MPRKTRTRSEFIADFNATHNFKYIYDKLPERFNSHCSLTIVCPDHGPFTQKAHNHLNHGCSKCKSDKISKLLKGNPERLALVTANGQKRSFSTDEFIARAKSVHGDTYDYSKLIYVNSYTKIEIICPKHGSFTQNPMDHFHGKNGCPKCGNKRREKQNNWLDSLMLPNNPEYREVRIKLNDGSVIFADGYNPHTRTVYEFWGDYFHGNPEKYDLNAQNTLVKKTFAELHDATIAKKAAIVASGFKLVEIWELDYDASVK